MHWFLKVTAVCKSGIRLELLIYLVIHLNEVMSGRCVNTCSIGCNYSKCCIDSHLVFPMLSCTSKALSELLLQILKLDL